MSRPAIGARTELAFGVEASFGATDTTPTDKILFTSHSLAEDITNLNSESIRPERALFFRKQGNIAPGGDINFEQNAQGYDKLYQAALGDGVELNGVDGGTRGQLTAAENSNQLTIDLNLAANSSGFSTSGTGYLGVVWRDSNHKLQYDYLSYTGYSEAGGIGTFSGVARDTSNGSGSADYLASGESARGDWIFKRDPSNWLDTVYTKVFEPARQVLNSLMFEIGLDIAYAKMFGVKINSISEDYPANAILTGTFSVLGKQLWIGDVLSADVSASATSITLSDASIFPDPASGSYKIAIGSEFDLIATAKNGNTLTLQSGTTVDHYAGEPVYIQQSAANLSVPTVEPLTFVEGNVKIKDYSGALVDIALLASNWSLTNNIADDQFVFGTQYRDMLPEQDRSVTGAFTVRFEDMKLYNMFRQADSARYEIRSISIDYINPSAGSGLKVPYQKHVIFPKIEFDGTTPQVGDKSLITIEMPFTALWDDDLNRPEMTVIMVNGASNIIS